MARPKSSRSAASATCLLYDPSDGHIVHIHTVVMFGGRRAPNFAPSRRRGSNGGGESGCLARRAALRAPSGEAAGGYRRRRVVIRSTASTVSARWPKAVRRR